MSAVKYNDLTNTSVSARLMQEAVTREKIEAFRASLRVGQEIEVTMLDDDGQLWYGVAGLFKFEKHTFKVLGKYPHVVLLEENHGKRATRTAMDYKKLYLMLINNEGKAENEQEHHAGV